MIKSTQYLRPITILLTLATLVTAVAGCAGSHASVAGADTNGQTLYPSADQAVGAMVDAIRAGDSTRLKWILGPGADQIISSGDDVMDRQNKQDFLARYDQKHAIVPGDNGAMTLTVGSDDWPLPIPLVTDGKTWRFDSQAGLDEILNRRIGRNELSTIQVCLAIVDAQREYVLRNPTDDELPQYAQKFLSDPGQKNGLYWTTADGEPPSPLGALVADAAEQGYAPPQKNGTGPHPFFGYVYRMLKSQGSNAPGGAYDYLADGKMLFGFGVIAYPAEYGNSGVMTFMVSIDGTVYQKDLGPDTKNTAESTQTFDPGEGWAAVPPPDIASSSDSK
jgi:hypothetical protein